MPRSVGVEFSFFGEKQINSRIQLFEGRVEDATPAFKEVGNFLRRVERKQWSTRGTFGGNRWEDTKPSTKANKRRKGGQSAKNANRILRDTDRLWKSVTTKNQDAISEETADSIFVSTKVDYARIHQTGAPKNNMPARRVFDLNLATRHEVLRILGAYIDKGILIKGVFR